MKLFIALTKPLWIVLAVVILGVYIRYRRSKYGMMSGVPWYRLLRDKGALGEFFTFEDLESFPGHYQLLTNLYLPQAKGGTTEVDLVFICEFGVFAIESKNYGGWIYGNEKNRYWTQVFPNQHKERFFNPIMQNAGHISALKHATGLPADVFHSIIVFSNHCQLKDIQVESDDVQVIKRKQLKRVMKEECITREKCLSKKEIDALYFRKLLQYSHADQDMKEEHIRRIQGK